MAASSAPSADEAMAAASEDREFVDVQVSPKLVERQIPRPATINLVPSADKATERQIPPGRLFVIQLAPEFVEVKKRGPINGGDCCDNTASLQPSADETRESPDATATGTLFEIHVTPAFVEV